MFYGDSLGLGVVRDKMREFHARLGDDFRPSNLLEKLANEGRRFQDPA
jgi:3-hydroxyacyl-CoA dehydrogenase